MIRLFVIDNHPVIVEGIRYLFHPSRDGVKVVGAAMNVHEAILKVSPDNLDVFILDLYIPQSDPVDNVRTLKRKFPGKQIVIYTRESSHIWIRVMVKEGVSAYLTKDLIGSEFKAAIHKVFKGETIFPVFSTSQSVSDVIGDLASNFSLQPIQVQIIQLLIKGLSIRQIADITGFNIFKVNYLLKKIHRQFKVKNNTELIARILRQNNNFMPDH